MKETTKLILSMPESMTCQQVADKLGVTYNSVISARRRYNDNYKVQKRCPKRALPDLYRMITDGYAYSKIAKTIGITEQAVFYHAKKIGVSREKEYNKPEVRNKIVDDYKRGVPIKVITLTYGCNVRVPAELAKKAGFMDRKKMQSSMHGKIISMLAGHYTVSEIAEAVGCSNQTVYNTKEKSLSQSE